MNAVEQAIIDGVPVYCPKHGELSDPSNQGTQDTPSSPVLCRACFRPLQLHDPLTEYEDCRGWVWRLFPNPSRWRLVRIGDQDVTGAPAVSVGWLGNDAVAGWHLWLPHGPSIVVEPDVNPKVVMDAAGPSVLALVGAEFRRSHEAMKEIGDLLVTVLAHLERKEDR